MVGVTQLMVFWVSTLHSVMNAGACWRWRNGLETYDHQLRFTVDKHNSQSITEKMPVHKINLQHKKILITSQVKHILRIYSPRSKAVFNKKKTSPANWA